MLVHYHAAGEKKERQGATASATVMENAETPARKALPDAVPPRVVSLVEMFQTLHCGWLRNPAPIGRW